MAGDAARIKSLIAAPPDKDPRALVFQKSLESFKCIAQEDLIGAIQQAAAKTASSFQELATDVEQRADIAATPMRQRQSERWGPPVS